MMEDDQPMPARSGSGEITTSPPDSGREAEKGGSFAAAHPWPEAGRAARQVSDSD